MNHNQHQLLFYDRDGTRTLVVTRLDEIADAFSKLARLDTTHRLEHANTRLRALYLSNPDNVVNVRGEINRPRHTPTVIVRWSFPA